MKKKMMALVLAVVMSASATACGSSTGTTETKGEKTEDVASEEGTVVVAQAMPTLNNPWYVQFANGSKDMAEKLGIKFSQVTNPGDSEWDPEAQIGIIENLIATEPDVIEIDPTSTDGINTAIEEAATMGITVVTSGSRTSSEHVSCSITADNYQGGVSCGKEMVKLLNGAGKIIVLDATPGRDVMDARVKGFKDGIADSQIEIVAEQCGNSTREEALTVMENLLQANPDIDAVWAANDEMALGAVEALRSVGKVGQVIVGGFDATEDATNSIQAGEMTYTIDQIPYEEGVRAIAISFMLAKGLDIPDEDIELPMTEASVVDPNTVDAFVNDKDSINAETLDSVIEAYGLTDYVK